MSGKSVEFRFRVWVHPEDGDSPDVQVWYEGLEPTATGSCFYSDWALESFQETDFRQAFDLDKDNHWQVVGVARIYGTYIAGEYDEDIQIMTFEKRQVRASFFETERLIDSDDTE